MARGQRDDAMNEQDIATFLAMCVRNAMEDFHVDYLSDAQMKELNPIIRNAIYTGLYAASRQIEDERCGAYVNFTLMLIPTYWEPPLLLPDLIS